MESVFLKLFLPLIIVTSIACNQKKTTDSSDQSKQNVSESDIQKESSDSLAAWQSPNIDKLQPNGFQAQFADDSKSIIYSNKTLDGLWKYDLLEKKIKVLCEKKGAGYRPVLNGDQIIYQVKGRKKHLEIVNIQTAEITQVNATMSSLSPQEFVFQEMMKQKGHGIYAKPSDDLNSIMIIHENKSSEIAPQGQKNYINVTLSPNQKLILYKVSGLGAFVSNLAGEQEVKLGDINSASWVDNTHVLFSESEDDGQLTTKSELYIQNINTKESVHLSKDIDEVLELPRINNEGNKIVANTPQGVIYLIQK